MPKRLTDEARGGLGSRLFEARQRAGKQQKDVAAAAGISVTAYTRWETGRVPMPDISHLAKAAEYMDVTVGWLLTGEQSVSPDALNQLRSEMQEIRKQLERLTAP